MSRGKEVNTMPPGWIDWACMTFGRPWIVVLAMTFIFTPSTTLLGALNSGAAFLKIGTGARPTAMGGAYTALADDVNALYYNPAGLARLSKREIGATHTEWLLDTRFDFIGYAHPTKMGTFGLGFTRLATGMQQGRDANRQMTASFEASDTAYTVGYSRKMANPLFKSGSTSLGTNFKLLQSRIGAYSASSMALDLGAHHKFDDRPLSLGVSLLNMGQGMRYMNQRDPLPLTLSLGGAYRMAGVMNLALDIRHEIPDKRTSMGIGTEYAVLSGFSLRAGYASDLAAQAGGSGPLGSLSGLGGGFGLRLGDYRADYTFTPFGDLGNVQRISLGARW